uniref:Glycosyltransferases n=1 Tax=Oryza punctata TaxID=4537 RepID=A0A0E0LQ65_ORYPU
MASAAACKKNTNTTTTTRNSRSRSPRSPVVLRRAMLHSSLCFLVGLLAGLVAPSDWPAGAAALLAPSGAVFLRTLRAINSNRNIIFSSSSSRSSSPYVYSPQQPQLVVVVTTTEQSDDPERRAAGLTRTAHALRLVSPPLLWLVVEEEHAAPPTARLLRRTGVVHRHLLMHKQKQGEERIGTQISMRREQQRNVALRHIEDHRIAGVVLFGGLADVYDIRLLHRLRDIRTFGAWPVATVSAYERKVMVQGPLCSTNTSSVITRGWFDIDMDMAAGGERRPAAAHVRPPPEMLMDVGGFAFSSWMLWDPHRWDRFPLSDPDTSQESVKFVQRVAVEEYNQSTMKGMPDSDCSQIMLWHIQTTL